MTYATQQDMIDRFSAERLLELTDRTGTGAIDQTVLGRALTDADQTINSYLAVRYTLPLADVPALVVRWACDLTNFNLYPDAVPPLIQARHDDVIASLKAVVAGNLSLEIDGIPEPEQPSIQAQGISNARVFTGDKLTCFINGLWGYR